MTTLFADLDPEDREAALSVLRADISRRRRRVQADSVAEATRSEKRCPVCEDTKPADAFGRNAARPDGLQSICRECR